MESECSHPILYETALRNAWNEKWKLKFTSEFDNDSDNRLGTYYGVNPSLEKYVPQPQNIMEVERILVTRYRTGSHSVDRIGKLFQHSTYESFMHLW